MNPERRSELEAKKARLKEVIKLRSYFESHLKPWLNIYDELVSEGIEPKVIYLAATLDQDLELILQAVEEQLAGSHKHLLEKVIQEKSLLVHGQLEEKYPTINPIRYMPEGESFMSEDVLTALKKCMDDFQLTEKSCMIIYPTYTPVMEMEFTDLFTLYDHVFEPMMDVCLIALDYSWIIFRSLEDEWVCVRK